MRILIADPNQLVRFSIERLLNQAGCFGVAVVGTLEDMLLLLGYPGRAFDLVLINNGLLDQQATSTLERLQQHRNVVMYRNVLHSGRIADPLARITEGLCGVPAMAATLHGQSHH
jgi:DNA-binding NarL/FixJ family response regulator